MRAIAPKALKAPANDFGRGRPRTTRSETIHLAAKRPCHRMAQRGHEAGRGREF
jgi:hypothetical protein